MIFSHYKLTPSEPPRIHMKLFRLFLLFLLTYCLFKAEAIQPIIPCSMNNDQGRATYISAAMIFQNEARFLKEWLEYHKAMGITHFYLYNNASEDHYWTILQPYVAAGEVELFDMPIKKSDAEEFFAEQRGAYDHALSLSRGNTEWLAILDRDEFICIPGGESLAVFLSHYLDSPGIAINWVMYGSSYIQELRDDQLQIENFTFRAPDDWGEHFLVKSIVRPCYVVSADIHTCNYTPGLSSVFANHQRFSHHPLFALPPIEMIRINHYWWGDENYFYKIKLPRRISWMTKYDEAQIEARRKAYNSVYDPSISPYVEKTKIGMNSHL